MVSLTERRTFSCVNSCLFVFSFFRCFVCSILSTGKCPPTLWKMCTKFGFSTDRSSFQSRLKTLREDVVLKEAFMSRAFPLVMFLFDNLGYHVSGEKCGFWQTITQAALLFSADVIDAICRGFGLEDGLASLADENLAVEMLSPPA